MTGWARLQRWRCSPYGARVGHGSERLPWRSSDRLDSSDTPNSSLAFAEGTARKVFLREPYTPVVSLTRAWRGKETSNTVTSSSAPATAMSPPCALAISRAMKRPRPSLFLRICLKWSVKMGSRSMMRTRRDGDAFVRLHGQSRRGYPLGGGRRTAQSLGRDGAEVDSQDRPNSIVEHTTRCLSTSYSSTCRSTYCSKRAAFSGCFSANSPHRRRIRASSRS